MEDEEAGMINFNLDFIQTFFFLHTFVDLVKENLILDLVSFGSVAGPFFGWLVFSS